MGFALASMCSAQDFFVRNEPVAISQFQKILTTNHIREYPIPQIGGTWLHMLSTVSYSTGGATIPLGTVAAVDIRDKKFFSGLEVTANLNMGSSSDWVDEPCKRENYLYKRSTGGKFKNINCVSINHIVTYYATPTGAYQQLVVNLKDQGVEIPPTIIRVEFTRYSDSGRRLVYKMDVNPELFGIDRDSTTLWGSSPWHKSFIDRDTKKVEFIRKLSKWAEIIQDRMDSAFEKNKDAFSNIPDLAAFIDGESTPVNSVQPTLIKSSLETKLKMLKDLFEKKLLTENQYNEQVKSAIGAN